MIINGKFDKYIDLEFSYLDNTKEILFNYNGYKNDVKTPCVKCGKKIRKGHSLTDNQNNEEWIFGNECVGYVFGAGVLTYKESMRQ